MFVKLEKWFYNLAEVNNRRILVQTTQFDEERLLQGMELNDSDEESEEDEPTLPDVTGYYILDLDTGGVSTLAHTVQHNGDMSSVVALGSTIYLLGRPIRNSDSPKPSSCYFLDVMHSSTHMIWKRAHPLITDKFPPLGSGVAFGGNIYCFTKSSSAFCQVFDPTQPPPHWRSINSTPDDDDQLVLRYPVFADYEMNRIMVSFYNTHTRVSLLYAYYPSEDRWECVVEVLESSFSLLELVTIANGVIYVHYHNLKGFFQAFDIATKQRLKVQLSPAVEHSQSHYLTLRHYKCLLYMGNGILCLLADTHHDLGDDRLPTTHIHLVQFQVELLTTHGKKEVLVTPLSTRVIDLDAQCSAYSFLAL